MKQKNTVNTIEETEIINEPITATGIIKVVEDARTSATKSRQRFSDACREYTMMLAKASKAVKSLIAADKKASLLARTDIDGNTNELQADINAHKSDAKFASNAKAFAALSDDDNKAYLALNDMSKAIRNIRMSQNMGYSNRLGIAVKGVDKLIWVDCGKEIKFSKALRGTTITISYTEKDGKIRDVKIIK